MVPVYTFIAVITILILVGLFNIITGGTAIKCHSLTRCCCARVSVALILRAFSSGSSSLTGVEAISNAVPFFKSREQKCSCNIDDHGCDPRFLLCGDHIHQLLVWNRSRSRSNGPFANRSCDLRSRIHVLRSAVRNGFDF